MAGRKQTTRARNVKRRKDAKAQGQRDIKTGRAVRKLATDLDVQSDLFLRVGALETTVAALEHRMDRLSHRFNAVRAVWAEGVKALEI